MPILASLNAKNRPKSPFSIGVLFSIISEFTVQYGSIVMQSRQTLKRAGLGGVLGLGPARARRRVELRAEKLQKEYCF
jgi:hypothetical protein